MCWQGRGEHSVEKSMKIISLLSFLLTIVFALLYHMTCIEVMLTLAITAGTIAYHFIMRLIVGTIFHLCMHNRADYTRKWYHISKTEMQFYQKIKVKQWKNKMPTYDTDAFDTGKHSWDEIVQTMCQSELVHETIILCSFVPIIASIWFGAFWVFVITSICSALFDLMFVFMQRFNRCRIQNMISMKKR